MPFPLCHSQFPLYLCLLLSSHIDQIRKRRVESETEKQEGRERADDCHVNKIFHSQLIFSYSIPQYRRVNINQVN